MTFDTKTKELDAIDSSILFNCQPCLNYHLEIAKDSGTVLIALLILKEKCT